MISVLNHTFDAAKAANRAALIAYLPAGFPDVKTSIQIIHAMLNNGVDIIEVGYPYSDPLMDGPTIQTAVQICLDNGIKSKEVFEAVAEVNRAGGVGLVMSYFNPIFKFGIAEFLTQLKSAGGAGVITPDLIPDEATEWISSTQQLDVARIFLVAPSSTDERIKKITEQGNGFIYAASLMGVTGVKSAQTDQVKELVSRIKSSTEIPVAVGLGVSTPEQAKEIAQFADAVIVGSAFVRLILDAPNPAAAVAAVSGLAEGLSKAMAKTDRI